VNAIRGAAIRLHPATDRLAVAEGIETVRVAVPRRAGEDWLDVLNRRSPT
jgi:hypothetical protein